MPRRGRPPDPNQSLIAEHGSWEGVYRDLKPEELPWNAGAPDSELVRLVESGAPAKGRAIDLGTGPGHDAIYLAKKGFAVLAIDIAPSAIKLAKENAKRAKAAGIDFRVGDILKLDLPTAAFLNDRGCFHALDPQDRGAYIERVHKALAPGGHLFLRTFSDKEPPGPGPYRFSRRELEDLFSSRFDFVEFKDGIFEGPRKPKAYLCLLRKKI